MPVSRRELRHESKDCVSHDPLPRHFLERPFGKETIPFSEVVPLINERIKEERQVVRVHLPVTRHDNGNVGV